jgi:hypothetical protein
VNIRTVSNPILPVDTKRVSNARDVKTDTGSQERDADGRRQPNQEPSKDPLNDEELKKAKEYLENMTGLKANGLQIEIETNGDLRVFLIRNEDGQVVRRILEWEMRALIGAKDKKVGQIFDKAA